MVKFTIAKNSAKIVVLFAIVKISDIFSAYFFVNFCLKILKNYTHWKKIATFYGNIYNCNFFWEILPIFRWKILHCAKKITFFYAKYCRKIFNAKITAKICETIYEKINGKHLNLLISVCIRWENPDREGSRASLTVRYEIEKGLRAV